MSTLIHTILGPVAPAQLGRVLMHEHLVSLYGVWGQPEAVSLAERREAALAHYVPLLTALREEDGVATIVEVTPGWEARGPADLECWAEISRRSGVQVVLTSGDFMGSGLGLLGRGRGEATVAQLADQLLTETTVGLLGTGVRAGIIKIHADLGDDYGLRLTEAAAIAVRETGLCLTTCTGDHDALLARYTALGVPPERLFFSHGDIYPLPEVLARLQRGCSYNLTLWGITTPRLVGWPWPILPRSHSPAFAAALIDEGYADRLCPAMDYSAMGGFTADGQVREDLYECPGRTYRYLFSHAVPHLRRFGVRDTALDTMLTAVPRRLLTPA